jgi:hypothetical protein
MNVKPDQGTALAANDDIFLTPERTARVAASIDDPCDEGGFDQFCRDKNGKLCRFHEKYCVAPDYPCIDRLRHFIAVSFLEEIAARRAREAGQA